MHSAGGAGTLRGMTRRFAWLLTCFLFAGLSTPLHAEDKAPVKPLRVALYDAEGSTGKGVPRVKEILAKVTTAASSTASISCPACGGNTLHIPFASQNVPLTTSSDVKHKVL